MINSERQTQKIEVLGTEIRSFLRSGVALSSFTQCIEELVYNAIDAKATCIAIRVDFDLYKMEVVDNGCGIDNEDMKRIG